MSGCDIKKKPKNPICRPKTITFDQKLVEKEEFRPNCQILFSSQNNEKVSKLGSYFVFLALFFYSLRF